MPSPTARNQLLTHTTTHTEPEPELRWFDLPKEILHRIARHLDWHTDLPRIRSVCPTWRARLPKNPPLISTTTLNLPSIPVMPFILKPSHFYLVTPLSQPESPTQPPWLIRVNQTSPNTYKLLSPFTIKNYFYVYPPIRTSLSLLNCNFLELSTTYNLITFLEPNNPPVIFSKKVVGGWALDSPFRFAILAKIEPEHVGPKLTFWKFGEKRMSFVKDPNSRKKLHILDIAYYNKKFYSFELNRFAVGIIDPMKDNDDAWVDMEFHPAPDIVILKELRCLVSFKGCPYYLGEVFLVPTLVGLYLVFEMKKAEDESVRVMAVYKMRESGVEGRISWDVVDTLDDQVFFIGYDTAFALPQASVRLPQWKPNSICLFNRQSRIEFSGYVTSYGMKFPEGVEFLERITYKAYWKYLSVFVMGEADNGVVSFEELPKEVFTGLFFPPPDWVKWHCPLLGGAEVKLDKLKCEGDHEDGVKDRVRNLCRVREWVDGVDGKKYDLPSLVGGELGAEARKHMNMLR